MKQIPEYILKIKKIYDFIVPSGKILQDIDNYHKFNDSNLNVRLVNPQKKEIFGIIGVLMWMFMIKYLLDFLGVFGEILFFLLIPFSALSHLVGEINDTNVNNNFHDRELSKKRVVEIFILQIIYIGFAFFSLRGFIGHIFLADTIATDIGWQTGSFFQTELAFYHLGIGIMAIICLWKRDSLWIGLIISKSIFLFGAAGVHMWDIIVNQNYSHGNTGTILILNDIVLPLLSIILISSYLKLKGKK